jgi:diadenosine tetraphosphate (Ap4A) HIT family hydrolase
MLTPYHDRLPYGERVPAEPVLGGPFFPFEGDLQVKQLEEPVDPEPPRMGEPGGKPCEVCLDPEKFRVWHNENWTLHAGFEPIGIPMIALLYPKRHVTLHDLPLNLAGELGLMIQRIAKAIGTIPGVGRTHFSRFGDGSEHFHLWFLARPLGMMQLRGPMLAVWDDLLPKLPDEEFHANVATMVAALNG